MKLGILTFHNIPNIGALLQAYSLCIAFRNCGVDCELIDYTSKNIENRELRSPKTGNIIKDLLIKYLIWPRSKKKIRICQNFMKEQDLYSKRKFTIESLKFANNEYDAFISGSDMIWNLSITEYDWTYFCDFVSSHNKKYAYGSSIGGQWNNKDKYDAKAYLSKYRLIGVRESDTCNLLKTMGIEASLVCDPTMLLTSYEWEKIAQKPIENNYVLVYFPSETNIRAAKKYAEQKNLDIVVLNWALPIKGLINVAPLSPVEWIGYFKYARAIFSGSFHGLLFSLYFEKPVWTDNSSNRIISILSKLDIKRCLIQQNFDLDFDIDYTQVTEKISKFRLSSMSFINQIIDDCRK